MSTLNRKTKLVRAPDSCQERWRKANEAVREVFQNQQAQLPPYLAHADKAADAFMSRTLGDCPDGATAGFADRDGEMFVEIKWWV